MLSEATFEALIELLDDPDEEVGRAIVSKLIAEGSWVSDKLRKKMPFENKLRNERARRVIQKVGVRVCKEELDVWFKKADAELVDAWIAISRIDYPELDSAKIKNKLESMRIDIWMMLNNFHDPVRKIQAINKVFFRQSGFRGNSEDYDHPDNSNLGKVMELKLGNPLSLCILYMHVARRLGLNLKGINLPRHFILGYFGEQDERTEEPKFFVNVFSGGIPFGRKELDNFLNFINLKFKSEYLDEATSRQILERMLNNLIYSYGNRGARDRVEIFKEIKDYIMSF